MLKQGFVDKAMSGTNVLKKAELKFSTMNIQDDLQHQKHPGSLFIPIIV
jgi:hypothetical protein